MKIKAYLFDADGENQEVEFTDGVCERVSEKQLLWINVLAREEESVTKVVKTLRFRNAPVEQILNVSERPNLDKYEEYYRLFINSVEFSKKSLQKVPIDFLVSKNIVITIQSSAVEYFDEFFNLEVGERHIGEMDAESFVATLLDLHIISYFRAVEEIERRVDNFDEKILTTDLKDEEFFSQMLSLRRDVAKLRRWLMPHRDVFFALSRPDFTQIAESDSAEHFKHLDQHFESALDEIESLRDTILSIFDLYTTRASHKMNNLMKRLTFATIIFGALSVIVGALGMNFDVDFFKAQNGFWLTLVGMGILALILMFIAKRKEWL